jgi:hypothetical protein
LTNYTQNVTPGSKKPARREFQKSQTEPPGSRTRQW